MRYSLRMRRKLKQTCFEKKMAARVIIPCGNRIFQQTSRYFKNERVYSFNSRLNALLSVTRSYNRKLIGFGSRNSLKKLDETSVVQKDISETPVEEDTHAVKVNNVHNDEKEWLTTFATTNKVLSAQEWKEAKALAVEKSHPVYGIIQSSNFESQVMLACNRVQNFSLARSLFSYCQSTGAGVPIVVLSKYISLCGKMESEVDEESLFNLCTHLTSKFPILDGNTAEDLIIGLYRTSKWRETLKYLEMMRLSSRSPTSAAFRCIAEAAFNAGDYDLGWEMVTEMKLLHETDCKGPLEVWVSMCKRADPSQRKSMALRLFEFIKLHEITLHRNIIEDLIYIFENLPDEKWTANITKMTFSGVCKSCDTKLESMALTDDEFAKLRDAFLDLVIRGKDIYLKTNPEEMERFLNFVKYTAPYSVVLDGLNVSYMGKNKNSSNTVLANKLLQVVRHFSSSDRKVLVLGRNHMKKWPKHILDQIKKQATVFFTENLSSDDPFILYAALYSGKGTRIISKDMMRDHLFVLGKANLSQVFKKWLATHQLELLPLSHNGEVYSKPILEYNPYPQSSAENRWHIPFYSDNPDQVETSSISWLCLENKKSTSLKVRRSNIDVKRILRKS